MENLTIENYQVVSQENIEYDRMLYCVFKNGLLVGVHFLQGIDDHKVTIEEILRSGCNKIFDLSKVKVSGIKQALHLCLHISEIWCNFNIYEEEEELF